MNLKRLQYFVRIVDIGSLTQAADVLHVAQPALSQQLATLEGEVRQQLLLRTKRGVVPPTGNVKVIDAECRLPIHVDAPMPASIRHVLVNAYAFGGNNISMVLGRV